MKLLENDHVPTEEFLDCCRDIFKILGKFFFFFNHYNEPLMIYLYLPSCLI